MKNSIVKIIIDQIDLMANQIELKDFILAEPMTDDSNLQMKKQQAKELDALIQSYHKGPASAEQRARTNVPSRLQARSVVKVTAGNEMLRKATSRGELSKSPSLRGVKNQKAKYILKKVMSGHAGVVRGADRAAKEATAGSRAEVPLFQHPEQKKQQLQSMGLKSRLHQESSPLISMQQTSNLIGSQAGSIPNWPKKNTNAISNEKQTPTDPQLRYSKNLKSMKTQRNSIKSQLQHSEAYKKLKPRPVGKHGPKKLQANSESKEKTRKEQAEEATVKKQATAQPVKPQTSMAASRAKPSEQTKNDAMSQIPEMQPTTRHPQTTSKQSYKRDLRIESSKGKSPLLRVHSPRSSHDMTKAKRMATKLSTCTSKGRLPQRRQTAKNQLLLRLGAHKPLLVKSPAVEENTEREIKVNESFPVKASVGPRPQMTCRSPTQRELAIPKSPLVIKDNVSARGETHGRLDTISNRKAKRQINSPIPPSQIFGQMRGNKEENIKNEAVVREVGRMRGKQADKSVLMEDEDDAIFDKAWESQEMSNTCSAVEQSYEPANEESFKSVESQYQSSRKRDEVQVLYQDRSNLQSAVRKAQDVSAEKIYTDRYITIQGDFSQGKPQRHEGSGQTSYSQQSGSLRMLDRKEKSRNMLSSERKNLHEEPVPLSFKTGNHKLIKLLTKGDEPGKSSPGISRKLNAFKIKNKDSLHRRLSPKAVALGNILERDDAVDKTNLFSFNKLHEDEGQISASSSQRSSEQALTSSKKDRDPLKKFKSTRQSFPKMIHFPRQSIQNLDDSLRNMPNTFENKSYVDRMSGSNVKRPHGGPDSISKLKQSENIATSKTVDLNMTNSLDQQRMSDEASAHTHTRQETLMINDASKYPQKSQKFDAYSNHKTYRNRSPFERHEEEYEGQQLVQVPTQQKNMILSSEQKPLGKTIKNRKLQEFNCIVGNKLSLRFQSIKVLHADDFRSKSNLTHIDLRNNKLGRLPDEICDLILLRELRIDYNFLHKLPFGMFRLMHLQYLSASQNYLKVIPQQLLHQDSKLEYLHLNDNQIRSVSCKIGNLKKLKSLILHHNQITEMPLSLGLYRDGQINELSLDWFMYLPNDFGQASQKAQPNHCKEMEELVHIQAHDGGLMQRTKILKGIRSDALNQQLASKEEILHQEIIDRFVHLCRYLIAFQVNSGIRQLQPTYQSNPQCDEYEEQPANQRCRILAQERPFAANEVVTHGAIQYVSENLNSVPLEESRPQHQGSSKKAQEVREINYKQNTHQHFKNQFKETSKQMRNLNLSKYVNVEATRESQQVSSENVPGKPRQGPRFQHPLTQREKLMSHGHPKHYQTTGNAVGARRNTGFLEQKTLQRLTQQENQLAFTIFLLFFHNIRSFGELLQIAIQPSKGRRLAHLIALNGHSYLMDYTLQRLQNHADTQNNLSGRSPVSLFINCVDSEQSSPLILALKNRRQQISKLLLDCPQLSLRLYHVAYCSPLHIALNNRDFKSSLKILNKFDNQAINSVDHDGNTPMHIVMRNFGCDPYQCQQIAVKLLKKGSNLRLKNTLLNTPLIQAFYFQQTEAIRFALAYNQQHFSSGSQLFDFDEAGCKLNFTPLHFVVLQNNYFLIPLLLQYSKDVQAIDMLKEDAEGRIAIALSHSVSAIHKTLKRALNRQEQALLRSRRQTQAAQVNQRVNKGLEIKHRNLNLRHMKKLDGYRSSHNQSAISESQQEKALPMDGAGSRKMPSNARGVRVEQQDGRWPGDEEQRRAAGDNTVQSTVGPGVEVASEVQHRTNLLKIGKLVRTQSSFDFQMPRVPSQAPPVKIPQSIQDTLNQSMPRKARNIPGAARQINTIQIATHRSREVPRRERSQQERPVMSIEIRSSLLGRQPEDRRNDALLSVYDMTEQAKRSQQMVACTRPVQLQAGSSVDSLSIPSPRLSSRQMSRQMQQLRKGRVPKERGAISRMVTPLRYMPSPMSSPTQSIFSASSKRSVHRKRVSGRGNPKSEGRAQRSAANCPRTADQIAKPLQCPPQNRIYASHSPLDNGAAHHNQARRSSCTIQSESLSDDANIKEHSSEESNCFDLYTNDGIRQDGFELSALWNAIDLYQSNQAKRDRAMLQALGFDVEQLDRHSDAYEFVCQIIEYQFSSISRQDSSSLLHGEGLLASSAFSRLQEKQIQLEHKFASSTAWKQQSTQNVHKVPRLDLGPSTRADGNAETGLDHASDGPPQPRSSCSSTVRQRGGETPTEMQSRQHFIGSGDSEGGQSKGEGEPLTANIDSCPLSINDREDKQTVRKDMQQMEDNIVSSSGVIEDTARHRIQSKHQSEDLSNLQHINTTLGLPCRQQNEEQNAVPGNVALCRQQSAESQVQDENTIVQPLVSSRNITITQANQHPANRIQRKIKSLANSYTSRQAYNCDVMDLDDDGHCVIGPSKYKQQLGSSNVRSKLFMHSQNGNISGNSLVDETLRISQVIDGHNQHEEQDPLQIIQSIAVYHIKHIQNILSSSVTPQQQLTVPSRHRHSFLQALDQLHMRPSTAGILQDNAVASIIQEISTVLAQEALVPDDSKAATVAGPLGFLRHILVSLRQVESSLRPRTAAATALRAEKQTLMPRKPHSQQSPRKKARRPQHSTGTSQKNKEGQRQGPLELVTVKSQCQEAVITPDHRSKPRIGSKQPNEQPKGQKSGAEVRDFRQTLHRYASKKSLQFMK